MMLSDFGSIASIISLVVGLVMGFSLCKITIKYNLKMNKLFSFINFGTISQNNKNEDS